MNAIYQYTETHRPKRINRLSYAIRCVFMLIGAFVAAELMDAARHAWGPAAVILIGSGVVLLLVLFIGLFRWILIPRLHDMGVEPAWAWSLLFFIHAINFLFLLALLFVPTDAFAKRSYVV